MDCMVIIHLSGSLIVGYSEWYGNLVSLALSKKIVLVSLNYRLNSFGFLAHEALGSVDPRGVSGNYGILDQQLALQWVQRNIGSFGGNPARVTLIGQSSGGTSIFALLSSPGSVGLFHGAISLSASPNMTIDLQAAYKQNVPWIQRLCPYNDSTAILDCLYNLKPSEVSRMFPASYNGEPTLPASPAGQGYEGQTDCSFHLKSHIRSSNC